ARHLAPDQPVFGVRDLGGDAGRPVAQIAAEHVAEVREAQPRGPYCLGGWSFGGAVAFEMALELERQGEEVAFLGLIDTLAPALEQAWPWNGDAHIVAGLSHDVAARAGRPLELDAASLEGLDRAEQVRRAVRALREQGLVPATFTEAA